MQTKPIHGTTTHVLSNEGLLQHPTDLSLRMHGTHDGVFGRNTRRNGAWH